MAERTKEELEIEKYLDSLEDNREEYERLSEDIFPMGEQGFDGGAAKPSRTHSAEDPVQEWMRQQRKG